MCVGVHVSIHDIYHRVQEHVCLHISASYVEKSKKKNVPVIAGIDTVLGTALK